MTAFFERLSFFWLSDGENKQTKVETVDAGGNPTAVMGEYFYDGDGKRVKKISTVNGQLETTVFIYDASGKLVAEYSTRVAPPSEAKVSYLTSDHLGSPRINTDQNGQVISRHDYHPFGEEIARGNYGTDDVRNRYTLYERDTESGLDFAQARYYKPSHGRFTSPDEPFADQFESNPQSWNLYSYVRNNPLNLTDPLGMAAGCPENVECKKDEHGQEYYIDSKTGEEVYIIGETREKASQATETTALLTGRRGSRFTNLERNLRHFGTWLNRLFSPKSPSKQSAPPAPVPQPNQVYGPPSPPAPVFRTLNDLFRYRIPRASELKEWAEAQGWVSSRSPTGPMKFRDQNGTVRLTIKKGSSRAPGSEHPHVELRDAQGDRITPQGNPTTKHSPGNHYPIIYDF